MPALPEYKTRVLLAGEEVPMVDGVFVADESEFPDPLPQPPVYLKAQIPGATSRAASGLVRRAETEKQIQQGLNELLAPGAWGQADGVLITKSIDLVGEYYAACMLDPGSAEKLPCGVLLFTPEGGSGVEGRTESLRRIDFSLLDLPSANDLIRQLGHVQNPQAVAEFLEGLCRTFARYKLVVLETNPIGLLADGSVTVVDCRAEFEPHAVSKKDKDLFTEASIVRGEFTRLERLVEKINKDDPAGTAFFREERQPPPEGAWRVATNLCGGGGKMLWEMTTGALSDIHSMNESDTSGGLSAFKSYRVLRAILSMEGSQVLLLTGSGMGFQDQFHLAAAVWKGLRESPTPLPALLRFGGTNEDRARALIEQVSDQLPVPVKTFLPHVFPSAMVDEIPGMVARERAIATPDPQLTGTPTFSVDVPPGDFFFFPDKWPGREAPPCVGVCPVNFLIWNPDKHTIEPDVGARCIGCLLCETIALTEGNGELRIRLDMPEIEG